MKNSSASTVTWPQTDDVAVSIEAIHYCAKSRAEFLV
jgi:hypothetical protein